MTDTKIPDQTINPSTVSPSPVQSNINIGSMRKEQVSSVAVEPNLSEFIKPTEALPQINKELTDLGVEAEKDEPNITDEHREVIDHAKQFTPVLLGPSGFVKLPMLEEEIAGKLKTGQDDDSGKWLAGLIQKVQKVIRAMGL